MRWIPSLPTLSVRQRRTYCKCPLVHCSVRALAGFRWMIDHIWPPDGIPVHEMVSAAMR